jgi:energy-converting hydrogenase Eha subunit A
MPPMRLVHPLAVTGLAAAVVGSLAVAVLHVLPPTDRLDPVRRTISEYALHETGWLFNSGVLILALGSFAVLLALVGAGLVRTMSLGAVALTLWCLGLAAVVYFPKHNWSVGPSASGSIHRVASLVAFIALPVAAIVVARVWRHDPRWRHSARWTVALAIGALLCFGVIIGAFVLEPFTGVRWWRAIPLGAVERALATAEVATLLALGWWARKAAVRPADAPTASAEPAG